MPFSAPGWLPTGILQCRGHKPGSSGSLKDGVGVGGADVGGADGDGDGDGEAPFWTKMVTVEPLASMLLELGC